MIGLLGGKYGASPGQVVMAKPKRPCGYPLCPELTEGRYCPSHQQKTARLYDQQARPANLVSFYNSAAWHRVRAVALDRDNHLCQCCLQQRQLTPAEMVHHIKEVRQHWELRLDLNNLLSLCNACHNKEHGG